MNKKMPVAILSPLCLCLYAGNARADLEPFSFGASESVVHQSNLMHTDSDQQANIADWESTTEFNAALSQPLGRDKLVASAAIDFNRYKRTHSLDGTGYQAAAELDWNTIGDLSGALGADSRRRQYVYGQTADATNGSVVQTTERNLQTDNHVFARVSLGGESRWTIFGGVDGNERRFSSEAYSANNERQWSSNIGTRYSTSPDLSFGLTGSYLHGEYPRGSLTGTSSEFSTRNISATTRLQASGNSAFDGSLGYTEEDNEALTHNQHFVSGSLNWTWTPPSHFTVTVGLKRSSDADNATGVTTGIVNANNLNGTSINNVANLDVGYALTAKISLDATASYTQRKYSGLILTDESAANGSTRTSRFFLTAHYQPTLTSDVSCGGGREVRRSDADIAYLLPKYTDNTVQCAASIRFE